MGVKRAKSTSSRWVKEEKGKKKKNGNQGDAETKNVKKNNNKMNFKTEMKKKA